MAKRILYIAPSLPLLTCTFIYREIFDLRDMGFEVDTVSMNRPPDDKISPEATGFLDSTLYLDKVAFPAKLHAFLGCLIRRPGRVLACIRILAGASPTKGARDFTRLIYHLFSACYIARRLADSLPDHIHCHFVTGATSIGMFLSQIINRPFSFTMHASAIWLDPIALRNKLEQCKFSASISAFNRQYVIDTYGQQFADKIHVVHCGIQMSDIDSQPRVQERTSSIVVVSVGQLMVRKGYHVLMEAARILKKELPDLHWTIVGEGRERPRLEKLLDNYDLHDTVTMVGAQPHDRIPEFLRQADIFSLPCVVGDDNTRDGIPVAMMEAMAWQLPVVSTDIVGLPELIETGINGILVEQNSPEQLADAIRSLALSPGRRQEIGEAARLKVTNEFNSLKSAQQLANLFDS